MAAKAILRVVAFKSAKRGYGYGWKATFRGKRVASEPGGFSSLGNVKANVRFQLGVKNKDFAIRMEKPAVTKKRRENAAFRSMERRYYDPNTQRGRNNLADEAYIDFMDDYK